MRRRATLSRASGSPFTAQTRALGDHGAPEATQTVSGIGCRWRPPANGPVFLDIVDRCLREARAWDEPELDEDFLGAIERRRAREHGGE